MWKGKARRWQSWRGRERGKLIDNRQDSLKRQDGIRSRIVVFGGLSLDRRKKAPFPLSVKEEVMMDFRVSTFAYGTTESSLSSFWMRAMHFSLLVWVYVVPILGEVKGQWWWEFFAYDLYIFLWGRMWAFLESFLVSHDSSDYQE